MELSDFSIRGYKPMHIRRWYERHALMLIAVVLAVVLFVTQVIVPAILPATATAKTVEPNMCRTNVECCEFYLAGEGGYVKEDAITKLCEGL